MENGILRGLFTENEIVQINNTPLKDRQHPIKRLLSNSDEHAGQVLVNTELALKAINNNNKQSDWINSIRNRLIDIDDYSASSSALSEIRAFGYLLEAGYEAVPIIENHDESTPDFHLIHNNKEVVVVEVYSRQMTGDEVKQLEEFRNQPWPEKQGQRVLSRSHVVTPFGKPGSGENTTENVISKLASIKQEESQFSDIYPCILWLDFQDEIWDMLVREDWATPLNTWNSGFYSGPLWYALYGNKGTPIFEGESIYNSVKMRHNGRFRMETKIDAVICTFPRCTIIFDNPFTNKAIPCWFYSCLINIPWFSFAWSYINLPPCSLKDRIRYQEETINYLYENYSCLT